MPVTHGVRGSSPLRTAERMTTKSSFFVLSVRIVSARRKADYAYARTSDEGGGFVVMPMRGPTVAVGVSSLSLCAGHRRRRGEKKGIHNFALR